MKLMEKVKENPEEYLKLLHSTFIGKGNEEIEYCDIIRQKEVLKDKEMVPVADWPDGVEKVPFLGQVKIFGNSCITVDFHYPHNKNWECTDLDFLKNTMTVYFTRQKVMDGEPVELQMIMSRRTFDDRFFVYKIQRPAIEELGIYENSCYLSRYLLYPNAIVPVVRYFIKVIGYDSNNKKNIYEIKKTITEERYGIVVNKWYPMNGTQRDKENFCNRYNDMLNGRCSLMYIEKESNPEENEYCFIRIETKYNQNPDYNTITVVRNVLGKLNFHNKKRKPLKMITKNNYCIVKDLQCLINESIMRIQFKEDISNFEAAFNLAERLLLGATSDGFSMYITQWIERDIKHRTLSDARYTLYTSPSFNRKYIYKPDESKLYTTRNVENQRRIRTLKKQENLSSSNSNS